MLGGSILIGLRVFLNLTLLQTTEAADVLSQIVCVEGIYRHGFMIMQAIFGAEMVFNYVLFFYIMHLGCGGV